MTKAPTQRSPKPMISLGLIALVIAVYLPVIWFGYVGWDDDGYASDNRMVQQGLTIDGVRWAFTTFTLSNWHPLTWLSLMLDVTLFGDNPKGHHAVNMLLHAANVLLLANVLWMLTGAVWRGAIVAALLAVHPIHVESVAWIAERKDVLSLLFWLLAMWAYVAYVRRPSPARYGLVALWLALGLLAKPMVVTLPVMLLLLDFWPLHRIGSPQRGADGSWRAWWRRAMWLVAEKLPLVGLCAASAITTFIVQKGLVQLQEGIWIPLSQRLQNFAIGYVMYLGKLFWPVDLAALYPNLSLLGGDPWSAWQVIAAVVLLATITVASLLMLRRAPYVAVGWLWFLITMLPVSGLVQIGRQLIADRYTYIPFIGLYIGIIWLTHALVMRPAARVAQSLAPAAIAVIITALSLLTYEQAHVWRDGITLFRHAIAVTDRNWIAHSNLAAFLDQNKRLDEALPHFRATTEFCPECGWTYARYGEALIRASRLDEAQTTLERAIALEPRDVRSIMNLGVVLFLRGEKERAVEQMRRGLQLDPNSAEGHKNLAMVLLAVGRADEAAAEIQEGLRLNPERAAEWEMLLEKIRAGDAVAPAHRK